ncbi:MAG: hypothetical protein JWP74_3679 [Marmoricola sp.]|nr:hypothetical protein [Marmoricola sp.]
MNAGSHSPLARLGIGTALATLAAVGLTMPAAQADQAPCSTSGNTTTCTFAFTANTADWTVPSGVPAGTPATFSLHGADGGLGRFQSDEGSGRGGSVTFSQSIAAGEVIGVAVGGRGGDGSYVTAGTGGFGGGGDGGVTTNGAGGGGGASRVQLDNVLLATAGGGGGGGGAGTSFDGEHNGDAGSGGDAGASGGPGAGASGTPVLDDTGAGGTGGSTGEAGTAGGSSLGSAHPNAGGDGGAGAVGGPGTTSGGTGGSAGGGGGGGSNGTYTASGGENAAGGAGGSAGGGGGGGAGGNGGYVYDANDLCCVSYSGVGGGGAAAGGDGGTSSGPAAATISVADNSATDGNGSIVISYTVTQAQIQTITFPSIADHVYGNPDFAPGATSSSGLPVSYTSTTPSICSIVADKVHIVAAGTCTVTAAQAGDTGTAPASSVSRNLTIAKAPVVVTVKAQPRLFATTFTIGVHSSVTGAAVSGAPVTVNATQTFLGFFNHQVSCSATTDATGSAHCSISGPLPLRRGARVTVGSTANYLAGSATS